AAQRTALESAGLFELLMFRSGPAHRAARLSLAGLFAGTQLNRIRALITARVATLLRPHADGPAFDIIECAAADIAVCALAELVGVAEDTVRAFIARTRRVAALLAAVPLSPPEITASATEFAAMTDFIGQLISEAGQTRERRHPITTALAKITQPSERRRFMADLVALLVTGYDTSVATLGNAVAALAAHPPGRRALIADPSLLPRAADELIRFDVAGQVVFRHALEATQVGTRSIEPGTTIALLIGAANRDPEEFDSPDILDPARQRGRPLSFGLGPHACIGAALARLQLNALLQGLGPYLATLVVVQPHAGAGQHGLIRRHAELMARIGRPVSPLVLPMPEMAPIPIGGNKKTVTSGAL
ncbi:MAG TPA: cytochrome P450, partial [Rhodopila sp.]|nr:cytochrome P450 [Rhodopila sp.]